MLSGFFSALGAVSDFADSSFLTSVVGAVSALTSVFVSLTTGATFSSVTVSDLTSISIPIFFLIFSAILADLPVLSLR